MSSTNIIESELGDFEPSVQISRILKILSDTIKNCELLLCLPQLLEDNRTLLHYPPLYLPPEEVDFIKETCTNVSQSNSFESDVDSELVLQSDMCLVVDLLLSKPGFVECCNDLPQNLSKGAQALLGNLRELWTLVAERLRVTPKMEAKQDEEVRRLFQQNIRNREEAENLQEKLSKVTLQNEQEIEEKWQLIKQQLDRITRIREESKANIQRKMVETERQINWDNKNSGFRVEELQTEAKATQYRREAQLKEHLNAERELRAKRYRVESQLAALMQKYDSDIGERQAALEELTASYEEEKQQMEVLQQQFDEQEGEYLSMKTEKEYYEKGVMDALLLAIRSRIAARTIQRYFRAYLERKRAKGKPGKKQKKKKAGKKKK